ncbi:MAG: insulinase family protein [Halioglobus sp.]|nr:insulinase family protein [Halioglobus sp.]
MSIARRGLLYLLLMPFVALSLSCATLPGADGQPVRSPNDDYAYRLLTLPNQLQVLLISDPDTPKAAASLTVMVGSGDNPPGRGGLAHFLEHMLFLGTDKYPDAAEYEQYITEHGGNRNAYTSFDHTNYFFDVDAPFLPEALDRFAQFFVAPRFDDIYVDREKNAVEAEYQMGLKSDGRRGLDVLQEVMNQEHPYSQFSVGSLESLADREDSTIREELLRFYERHYSANQMRLAVLGAQSLDELEALVSPMFAEVENRDFQHSDIAEPLFAPGSLPLAVSVRPLATLRELEVSFAAPDYRPRYRANPMAYVGNLVGHEGEGSLLSQLKAEGLAESLAAGSALAWRGGSLFSINIALTEKGAQQRERILQLLFAYLDMLREEGPREWLFEEQSRVAALSFRFREQGKPISYVSALSTGMHYYAPEDVLRGPYRMDQYDETLLRELVDLLRPENAMVVFSDQSVETDTVSEHYEVPYASAALDIGALALPADDPARAALRLPGPNEFIAEDVALLPLPQEAAEIPQVVVERERQRIWYMHDDQFRVPRAAIFINFRSTEVGRAPEQAALAALYTSLISDSVNEYAYPARLAGLSFRIYKHAQGISLKVRGYNDKQLLLLERLLQSVRNGEFDPQRFEDIRQDMIRALRNVAAKRPSSQVMADLREALWHGEWGEEALIAALEAADPQSLADYADAFWRGATAEALVYGNHPQSVTDRLSGMLDELVSAASAPQLPGVKILRLAAGDSLQYPVDIDHDDAVLAWYLQGAGDSVRDRAATALTAQIMKSGFFQQLRTEQQLGYIVSAFKWPQHLVPGIVMLIQSPVADASQLAVAMEEFLGRVIGELDQEQFERHVTALRNDILRPHKNLAERADFYWRAIARKQWQFDGREQLADALSALTLEDWQAYFTEVFLARSHSLQVVAPGRWDKLPAGDYEQFDAATAIKAQHSSYHRP